MNDQMDHMDPSAVSANGTGAHEDADGSAPIDDSAWSFDGDAIDARLDSMLHSIRSWDWRAASLHASSPDVDVPASTGTSPTATASQDGRPVADPVPLTHQVLAADNPTDVTTVVVDPAPVTEVPTTPETLDRPSAVAPDVAESAPDSQEPDQTPAFVPPTLAASMGAALAREEDQAPGESRITPVESGAGGETAIADTPPSLSAQDTPPAAAAQPLVLEATPTAVVAPVAPSPPEGQGAALGDSTSWLELEYGPESKPEPERPNGPLGSRSRFKVYGLVALAVIVLGGLIAGGILLFSKSPTPSGQTQTTTNPGATPATSQGEDTSHTNSSQTQTSLTSAQLAQYDGYAQNLQAANQAAAAGFDKTGTPLTSAQLALVEIQYGKELVIYNTDLDSISWPAPMLAAVQADHAQLQSLMSFLRTFSIVQPAGVSAWLVQLHGRTSSAEIADNQLRHKLGLPSTTSFP